MCNWPPKLLDPAPAQRREGVSRRCGYTIVELLVVIAIISVLLALLMPAVQAARESARSATCSDHLRQLALGIHSYHASHNRFPTGSTLASRPDQPGHSWLVYCLPFIEEADAADKILRQGASFAPPIALLFCPSDAIITGGPNQLHVTSYGGSGGAGKDPNYVIDLEDKFCGDVYTDGIFFPLSKTAANSVTDGLSRTIAIGERKYFKPIWSYGAYWVGAADQQVCAETSKNIRWPINSLPATSGYYVGDRDAPANLRTMRLNDLYFGSQHPGGAWFAFAGGNVEFLADDIGFSVYQDLASRNGGEPTRQADRP